MSGSKSFLDPFWLVAWRHIVLIAAVVVVSVRFFQGQAAGPAPRFLSLVGFFLPLTGICEETFDRLLVTGTQNTKKVGTVNNSCKNYWGHK